MMRTGHRHAEPCAGWPGFVRFLDSAERRLCAQVEYRNGRDHRKAPAVGVTSPITPLRAIRD
jgi:hypothetical protein